MRKKTEGPKYNYTIQRIYAPRAKYQRQKWIDVPRLHSVELKKGRKVLTLEFGIKNEMG